MNQQLFNIIAIIENELWIPGPTLKPPFFKCPICKNYVPEYERSRDNIYRDGMCLACNNIKALGKDADLSRIMEYRKNYINV